MPPPKFSRKSFAESIPVAIPEMKTKPLPENTQMADDHNDPTETDNPETEFESEEEEPESEEEEPELKESAIRLTLQSEVEYAEDEHSEAEPSVEPRETEHLEGTTVCSEAELSVSASAVSTGRLTNSEHAEHTEQASEYDTLCDFDDGSELTDLDEESEQGANYDSESDATPDSSPPSKDEVIRRLRTKAFQVRNTAIEMWSMQKYSKGFLDASDQEFVKKAINTSDPIPANKERCPVGSCERIYPRNTQQRRRHISTHYPEAFFCPVCGANIVREDSLNRHFRSYSNNCLRDPKAARYLLGRGPQGQIIRLVDKKYFNIYYLGAMEYFDMPAEHFHMIARRARYAPYS